MTLTLLVLGITGVAVAGIARVMLGRGWRTAIGAGIGAVLIVAILTDYLWYPLAAGRIPEGQVVARVTHEAAPLRPWTLLVPAGVRFVTVDQGGATAHGVVPGQRIVPLHFIGKREPAFSVSVLFDCLRLRSATLVDGTAFADNGTVISPDWQDIAEEDPILDVACALPLESG